MGYFYQNPETGTSDDFKCYFQPELYLPCYVPLLPNAAIYQVPTPKDVGKLDTLDGVWCDDWLDSCFFAMCCFHAAFNQMSDKPCSYTTNTKKGWNDPKDEPCKFYGDSDFYKHSCPHIAAYFPLYVFPAEPPITNVHNTTLYWYVVHPDENERMERILNGTDNPLYDLVHELRYNPAMPAGLSAERKEAQERFEENTAKKTRTE